MAAGLRLRDYLALTMDYRQQYNFGVDLLRRYGVHLPAAGP
jgi:hypothetical protein